MRQRLTLFLLGFMPILFVELALSLQGVQAGMTIASAFMLIFGFGFALLFQFIEKVLRPLVPVDLRGQPVTNLAMGLAMSVAVLAPNLMPEQAQISFYNHFRWVLGYHVLSLLILYPIVVRLLGKRSMPQRSGYALAALVVVQLLAAVGIEARELAQARARKAIASAAPTKVLEAPQRPNVLLLVLDTLRFDTLHQTWQGQQHFPALDAYTEDAAFFQRGYAGCNVTPGGHTTLFTGMYPAETGTLPRGLVSLDDQYLTVAEFLRSYGYRTVATVSNARVSGRFGYEQGFEVYDDSLVNPVINFSAIGERFGSSSLIKFFGAPYSRKLVRSAFVQMSWGSVLPIAEKTTKRALEVVDKMDIGEDEPWFMFLNYIDPHTPFVTRADLAEAFGPNYVSERLESVRRSIPKFHLGLQNLKAAIKAGELRENELNWLQEVYREQCLELDEGVDQLLQGLRDNGMLDDNTLILITSDHGEHLGEHNAYNHGSTLLDEEVRVPFLLLGPGIEKGIIETPVSGADFFSTVCYAMGLDPNDWPETAGIPLQLPQEGRYIRFEHGELRGFLQGTYKMIAHDIDGELEWVAAYDLATDPKELDNLISSGLEWVEDYKANPPIESSEGADIIEIGDDSLDLGALGYADEVQQ
ncbi:MAG: sulfatase [Planctomycetota bacterium]|jgi:arylsulfatase A-like enzyme|nr:sulfatase [Planctomycetota bacterium]